MTEGGGVACCVAPQTRWTRERELDPTSRPSLLRLDSRKVAQS